jgi:CheY-like chemotaxis protein
MAIEAQPAKQAKVLVVEDDAVIHILLADMLGEIGYTVTAAALLTRMSIPPSSDTVF